MERMTKHFVLVYIYLCKSHNGHDCPLRLFYRLLATIILHLRKHKLQALGDDLMLCYLYLLLTHLAGGQNCVT